MFSQATRPSTSLGWLRVQSRESGPYSHNMLIWVCLGPKRHCLFTGFASERPFLNGKSRITSLGTLLRLVECHYFAGNRCSTVTKQSHIERANDEGPGAGVWQQDSEATRCIPQRRRLYTPLCPEIQNPTKYREINPTTGAIQHLTIDEGAHHMLTMGEIQQCLCSSRPSR